MRLRLSLLALTTVVLVGGTATSASANHYDHLLAPMTRCGGSSQTNTGLSPTDQELVMLCMHNRARAKVGRAPLGSASLLASSSDAKTADMIRCRQFTHTACGRAMTYHFNRVGYTSCSSWRAGENIAWGSGRYATVRSRMSAWLHSDPHRRNILSPSYREAGFGMRVANWPATGARVWTAHFGYRSGC